MKGEGTEARRHEGTEGRGTASRPSVFHFVPPCLCACIVQFVFGSHLSIAGGVHHALLEAETLNCETVQIFTKNQQQWKCKPLAADAIAQWKTHCQRLKFESTVSHDSYLINLASPDDRLWNASIELFREEIMRCAILGIPYLVTHPGAHVGTGEDAGLTRVAKGLDRAYAAAGDVEVVTCLEITAGQGSSLGYRLEHLAEIISRSANARRLGVCLDTAHLFAAGYDFRGRRYAKCRKEVDRILGLKRVKVLHLNDSKKDLGSRVDRHEHIGLGKIGKEGFIPIVRDKAFCDVPKILETPKLKHPSGKPWDEVNLRTLHSMLR
jgi:deoxyribonuclease IV